jgi:hypothetical protein
MRASTSSRLGRLLEIVDTRARTCAAATVCEKAARRRAVIRRLVGVGRTTARLGALVVLSLAGCYTGVPEGRGGSLGWETATAASAESVDDGIDDVGDDDGNVESTDGTGGSDELGEEDESSSTGEPVDPNAGYLAAVGITPTGVHVNQGVAIAIADANAAIPGGTRSARVLHGRRTIVFGTWTLAPDFVARMIRAELHLVHQGGTEERVVSETFVQGPSGPNDVDAHFQWTLEPTQLPAGTRWFVSLHELDVAPEGTPQNAPRLPAVGDSELDDEDGNQRIRIVFIPYRHQYNGCDRLAPSDAATLDGHKRAMESMYPTQQVEITLHPEVAFGAPMSTLDAALTNVLDIRAAEAPAADVYYYGFLWPCDESNAGGLGYVPFNPATVEEAPYRSAVGVYYDFAPDYSYGTMVHEIGHNHGREHVACAGTEGTTDPAYPVAGGAIGVLGWGIHDGVFHNAAATDYMTYCENQWVSTYGWSRALTVIDALTVAVGGAPPPTPTDDGPGAVVLAVRDGEITTATRIPELTPRRNGGAARWMLEDGSVAWATWQEDAVPDSDAQFFTVALPERFEEASALELDTPSGTIAVAREQIATPR